MEIMAEQIKLQTQQVQQLLNTPASLQTLDDNKNLEKSVVVIEQSISTSITTYAVIVREQ